METKASLVVSTHTFVAHPSPLLGIEDRATPVGPQEADLDHEKSIETASTNSFQREKKLMFVGAVS